MSIEVDLDEYTGPRSRHRARSALLVLVLLVVFGAAAWVWRVAVLRETADLWIVSDVPHAADAVAVLGGGLSVRPAAAASYYSAGLVHKVLVSNVHLDAAEAAGVVPSHTSLLRRAVEKLGVPDNAVELFGHQLSSTYEEIIALREWAVRNHARSIIIPTEVFSARRLRWVSHRVFANAGIEIQVPAVDAPDYRRDAWWRNEQGVITFQNEIVKYVYYRLKY